MRLVASLVVLAILGSACADDGAVPDADGAEPTAESSDPEVDGDPADDDLDDPEDPTGADGDAEDPADGDGDDPASSASAADRSPTARSAVPEAVWAPCEPAGLECATVEVPLDHDDPSGPTIDLALIRVPATATDGAVGSILVNPGGPGGSGVALIRNGFRLDPATMADHHLVGFDPRGVGGSSALACRVEAERAPRADFSPDDDAERDELETAAVDLASACERLDGDLLPHLGTDAVVEDLDWIRRAVGDESLRYIGLSYGTVIGLRYLRQHPDRVGRMVLDGVVDPSRTLPGLLAQQADGFERLFAELERSCGSAPTCPAGGVGAATDRVMARLEASGPIDGFGPAELDIASLVTLYSPTLWPRYLAALTAAENGDTSDLASLVGIYSAGADQAAYHAVVCTDGPVPQGSESWDRLVADLEARSPRFGALLGNELRACAHWPTTGADVLGRAVDPLADGATPVLVLSTTGDAATPLANAVAVADDLGRAALVTVDDTGHTAYGRNACVSAIVADYLATGRVPDDLHRC